MASVRTRATGWPEGQSEKPYDVGGFVSALTLAMIVGAASWVAVIASVARFL
jgi:hypothetical protein